MSVTLVASPQDLAALMPSYGQIIDRFSYNVENDYRAFVKGDKVAEYGLSALIVGGATAVAAKSGLLKYLWKLILVGVAGIGALLKKLFRRQPSQEPIAKDVS